MRLIAHLIFSLFSNLVAILAASYFIIGFEVVSTLTGFITVTVLLTIANLFLRPILKFILTPIIVLTLGLFALIINAALLYALDFFSGYLTIEGLVPLILGTLLISAVNFILHLFDRHLHKS